MGYRPIFISQIACGSKARKSNAGLKFGYEGACAQQPVSSCVAALQILQYQVPWKSIQRFSSSVRTDGQT
jgi:hypothetical protein